MPPPRPSFDAVTSVVNLLEVCGILSFDLNERQLRGLYRHFGRRFGVRIVPEDREGRAVMPATPSEVLTLMAAKMRLGDALVAGALARWAPTAGCQRRPGAPVTTAVRCHATSDHGDRRARAPDRPRTERLVNIGHAHAPQAKLCFNTRPADTVEAVRRWI